MNWTRGCAMGDVINRVRRFLGIEDLDRAAEARREREEQERVARLARDPFRFPDRESWLRFRKRHGFPTRGL